MNEPTDVSLYACVLVLTAERDCTVPATQGHLAHAAFLDIVRAVDPPLAETLHASAPRKPFTVSPLHGLPAAQDGRVFLHAGQTTWLRITLLDGGLFQTFVSRFLFGLARPALRLAGAQFALNTVLVTSESHPWAGYTTTRALWEQAMDEKPLPKINLELATPTAFSLGRDDYGSHIELFPRPDLVFANLQNAWNGRGYQPLDPALRDYVQRTVVVARYRLETRMCELGHSRQLGAVGDVTFWLRERNDLTSQRMLHLLASFAFYAGLGYKTTMGMGMVRRFDELYGIY